MNAQAFFTAKAIQHSRTCFLNSLLREWSDFIVADTLDGKQIEIKISKNSKVIIPLTKYSILGRHQFGEKSFLQKDDDLQEIDFFKLSEILSDRLAADFDSNEKQIKIFKTRLANSVANIEASLQYREVDIEALQQGHINFKDSEQGLLIGHNFHPTPKSRDEFSDDDLKKYSPEFGGHFALQWFMASPEILYQKSAEVFKEVHWAHELAEQEILPTTEFSELLAKGFVPVPMHPWQTKILLHNTLIQQRLASGLLVSLGPARLAWYPTSSLRSVYREEAPYMLKFSMSVRLTNSVRHLLPHEVERGLQLFDVLATKPAKDFLGAHKNFHVVGEPAYLAFKNEDSSVMAESIVVCRENPFRDEVAENKIVLATLAQDSVLGKQNLVQYLIQNKTADDHSSLKQKSKKWFAKYLEVAVKPFVIAQANYGIILGAHQQNLIIGLKDGFPEEVFFRDCQGTGYSELGFQLFAGQVSSINRANGNVVSAKMGNYLFVYYLILNSTFNMITAISGSDWISEEELLSDLKLFLTKIYKSNLNDPDCLEYLLFESELMHKGNFICSFKDINENTTLDPLEIYTPVKNSVKEVRHD